MSSLTLPLLKASVQSAAWHIGHGKKVVGGTHLASPSVVLNQFSADAPHPRPTAASSLAHPWYPCIICYGCFLSICFPYQVTSSFYISGNFHTFWSTENIPSYIHWSLEGHPMHGGAWQATVHRVAKSWTWLSDFTLIFIYIYICIYIHKIFSLSNLRVEV